MTWTRDTDGCYNATDTNGRRWSVAKCWQRTGGEAWRLFCAEAGQRGVTPYASLKAAKAAAEPKSLRA